MILKIQKQDNKFYTNGEENDWFEGWAIFGDIKEIHQLEERQRDDIEGRLYDLKCQDSNPRFFKHLLIQYKDGSTDNVYYDGAAYLMNENGKTVESL